MIEFTKPVKKLLHLKISLPKPLAVSNPFRGPKWEKEKKQFEMENMTLMEKKSQHSNYCTNSTIFKYKIEEHFHDKIKMESRLGVGNGLVPAVLLADESQYLWHLPTL